MRIIKLENLTLGIKFCFVFCVSLLHIIKIRTELQYFYRNYYHSNSSPFNTAYYIRLAP